MIHWSRELSTLRTIARLAGLPFLGLCLGLLAAQAVTQWTPPTYQASASLVISARADGEAGGQETASISLAQSLAPTIARMVETREVAIRAADSLKLPPAAVVGQVTGGFEPGLQIVTVSATAGSADQAAAVANGATEAVIGRLADFSIAEGVQVNARILDHATVPGQPDLPKPTLNGALGALAGLLAGLGLTTARNRFDSRLRDVQAIETQLGLPVLAVFPRLPRRFAPRHLRSLHRGQAMVAADTLVASLNVFVESLPGRRIMVTSARYDDGKAIVAAMLALRIARGHDRVTLIEGQEAGRRDPQPGADSILLSFRERVFGSPEGAFVPTIVGADIVDQWSVGRQSGDLLDEVLSRRGDDLVVHGPPILTGTRAAALAREIDGVVLVVRRGATDAADAQRASTLMQHLGVPFVGVVVVDGAAAPTLRSAGRVDRMAGPGSGGGQYRQPNPPDGDGMPTTLATPAATNSRAAHPPAPTTVSRSTIPTE
ncbi:hypothetical protein [Micromonospora sp. LOL_023]|uniref:hypothetical protein n=1 Tax=Micromonospora sp. LOL_023 TaxID=3345418 RepID=UPI003A8B551D